jgi:hypothetical protein
MSALLEIWTWGLLLTTSQSYQQFRLYHRSEQSVCVSFHMNLSQAVWEPWVCVSLRKPATRADGLLELQCYRMNKRICTWRVGLLHITYLESHFHDRNIKRPYVWSLRGKCTIWMQYLLHIAFSDPPSPNRNFFSVPLRLGQLFHVRTGLCHVPVLKRWDIFQNCGWSSWKLVFYLIKNRTTHHTLVTYILLCIGLTHLYQFLCFA